MKSIRDLYVFHDGHYVHTGKAAYDSVTNRVELGPIYYRDVYVEETLVYVEDDNQNKRRVGSASVGNSDGHILVSHFRPDHVLSTIFVVEPNTAVPWWPVEDEADAVVVYPVSGPGSWLPPYLPRHVEDYVIVYNDRQFAAVFKQMRHEYPDQNTFVIGRWCGRSRVMKWALSNDESPRFEPIAYRGEVVHPVNAAQG